MDGPECELIIEQDKINQLNKLHTIIYNIDVAKSSAIDVDVQGGKPVFESELLVENGQSCPHTLKISGYRDFTTSNGMQAVPHL